MPLYRSRVLICGLLFVGLPTLNAQIPAQPPAKPAEALPGIRQIRDVPYVLGGHERQRLDLYLPAAGGPARPLVVWVHGGGWSSGDKNGCPAKWLVERGYAVASIGYRLSGQALYPAQIEDCKAAIRFLRAHAAEYSIRPERIGAWGASAGGHLVGMLGTTGNIHDFDNGANLDQSSGVQCVVDWFGPTDFLHYGAVPDLSLDTLDNAGAKLIGGRITENPEKARRASPIHFVTKDAAPFLIMQGEQDNVVPAQQSEILDAALKKAGVESTLKVFPGATHGGPAFTSQSSMKMILDFFDRYLKK